MRNVGFNGVRALSERAPLNPLFESQIDEYGPNNFYDQAALIHKALRFEPELERCIENSIRETQTCLPLRRHDFWELESKLIRKADPWLINPQENSMFSEVPAKDINASALSVHQLSDQTRAQMLNILAKINSDKRTPKQKARRLVKAVQHTFRRWQ